jgi:hypothetical protein
MTGLHEERNNLYISPDIMMIKSRRTRWAGRIKHMRGEEKRIQNFGRRT